MNHLARIINPRRARINLAVALLCLSALFYPSIPASAETAAERISRLQKELEAAQKEASQADRGDIFQAAKGALILVKSDDGAGSGFIARMKGRTFFITNIHVLGAASRASFQTVNGTRLELPDLVFVSKQRDIAIVPISWDGPALDVSESLVADTVNIDDAIVVMGNSDGAGVVTQLKGKINGMGPQEMEISAKFVPGNSGSPILHSELGKVVGVVSHMRDFSEKDRWTQDSELADIRRFGFRLDGEIEWQQLSLTELFQQGALYAKFEERTGILAHTIYMMNHERTIMTNYSSHESLGYMFDEIDDGFVWKRGTSSSHNMIKLKRFVASLRRELVSDQDSTAQALTVEFYKRRFQQVRIVRDTYMRQLKDTL